MPPAKPRTPVRSRRPFRDNPPLILAGIAILLAALGGIVWLADRTARLSPDFLTEVVLYALYATNITMLVALGFVLARNVIKSVFDGRSGLPLGRFRAKLVLAFLGLTVIPAVLVLIVGSRVVLTAVDRWFNTPMEEILAGANSIAADYYQERERLVTEQASRLARELGRVDLSTADMTRVQSMVTPEVTGPRVAVVQVYRVDRLPGQPLAVVSLVDVASPSMPQGWARGSAERLAGGAATGRETTSVLEQLAAGGDLLHVGEAVKNAGGQVTGVVVVSEYLSGERAERSRRMTKAYEDYTQLQVLKQPLAGVYVSFFVMVTLLILVGSTWMGLYWPSASLDRSRCCRKWRRQLAPVTTIAASNMRAPTSLAPWSKRSTPWLRKSPQAGAGSSERASISSASTTRARAAAAISRRFLSALPPASSRSIAPDVSARLILPRCACSKSTPAWSAVPPSMCLRGPTSP